MMSVSTIEYADADVLQFLLNATDLDIGGVAEEMRKAEKEKLLEQHPFPITQGKDGRWRTYIKNEDGKRKQIAKATKEKVCEELYLHYKELMTILPAEDVTVESLFPQWLEYKRLHGASSTSLSRLDSDWRTYYEGTEIVKIPLQRLSKLMLDVWAHQLIERVENAKKQYYNISVIMRQVLNYVVDAEIISGNPLQKVRIEARQVFNPVKKKPSETQVFTVDEVEALYRVAREEFESGRNQVHKLAPLAVMFQFQTGVRIGELCALRYEDIEDDEIYVNRMYRFESKEVVDYTKAHNAGRYVTLTTEAKDLIAEEKQYQQDHGLSDDGYIFSINENPLSYYSIRKSYDRYCKAISTIHKSSHKSRKTYISALIDGGVNINEIREMVGHADERTTYGSYCYDRKTKPERTALIEAALSTTKNKK